MSELQEMRVRVREMEKRIDELQRLTAKLPTRIENMSGGSGSGAANILHVAANKTALDLITPTEGHIGFTQDAEILYYGDGEEWKRLMEYQVIPTYPIGVSGGILYFYPYYPSPSGAIELSHWSL